MADLIGGLNTHHNSHTMHGGVVKRTTPFLTTTFQPVYATAYLFTMSSLAMQIWDIPISNLQKGACQIEFEEH